MSLLALALQVAATGALAEVMPDWVRVEMEPSAPLALADTERRVILAVFIGDETATVPRRRWAEAEATVELVLQVILPAEVDVTLAGKTIRYDTRKAGIRMVYAAVHRIVERLFVVPDDDGGLGTWGAILQTLIVAHDGGLTGMPGVAERPALPGQPAKLPVPVWDYSIPCKLIKSPPLGRAARDPWPQLVARMRATPKRAGVADHVAALIEGTPLPPWRSDQAAAGLSRVEGDALGIGTVFGAGETPEAERLTNDADLGLIVEERGR